MEEQLIEFETAKLLKEKGFPKLETNGYPSIAGGYTKDGVETMVLDKSYFYQAPTQSLLQKWLRDTHNIHLTLDTCINGYTCYLKKHEIGKLVQPSNEFYVLRESDHVDTYESALETGLQTALSLI